MSLLIYRDLMKISKTHLKMEFVTLVLLSTLGVFISISARDFILLFCVTGIIVSRKKAENVEITYKKYFIGRKTGH